MKQWSAPVIHIVVRSRTAGVHGAVGCERVISFSRCSQIPRFFVPCGALIHQGILPHETIHLIDDNGNESSKMRGMNCLQAA
jgi:hypothetical protein